MNIGIDIDGVLNDIEKFQLKYGSIFFRKKRIKKYIEKHYKENGILLNENDIKDTDFIINLNGYGIKEIFDCTDEEEVEFWTKYTHKFFFEPARVGASDTIKKLRAEGHKIFIISSRALTNEDSPKGKFMRMLVEKWLDKNNIEYDGITYCSIKNSDQDKLDACIKYGIDVMVEDKRENILTLSDVTKVLCMNTKNNQGISGNNITCVNNFEDDIYNEIKKIYNEKYPFEMLDRNERIKLSNDELISYHTRLKEYYLSLPYNDERSKQYREQCERTIKKILFFFDKVYNPKVLNKERLSNEPGGILVSNHLHSFDPLMIAKALDNKQFRLLAKAELLKHKLAKLFKYIDAIFADENDHVSKKEAVIMEIKALLHDEYVMHFPEGHRNNSKNPNEQKYLLDFKYGAVDIAQKTGVPLIPFALTDNYKIRSKDLYVNVGEPVFVKPGDDLTKVNETLRDTIATLLWEIMEEQLKHDKSKNGKQLWKSYKEHNHMK